MANVIEVSVVGEASIKNNKVLVDYTELKALTESHGKLLELLRTFAYEGDYEGRPTKLELTNKAREAIKEAEK